MKFWTLFSAILWSATSVLAQHDHRGICGTVDEGDARLIQNIAAAKAFAKTGNPQKGNITYIPVRCKIIGRTDRTQDATVRMEAIAVPHRSSKYLRAGGVSACHRNGRLEEHGQARGTPIVTPLACATAPIRDRTHGSHRGAAPE